MTPGSCPRFERCGAPVCPLDPGRLEACHLPGEPVCGFLLAVRKREATRLFAGEPAFEVVAARAPELLTVYPRLAWDVARAADRGFPGSHRRGVRVGQRSQTGPESVQSCSIDTDPAQGDVTGPEPHAASWLGSYDMDEWGNPL